MQPGVRDEGAEKVREFLELVRKVVQHVVARFGEDDVGNDFDDDHEQGAGQGEADAAEQAADQPDLVGPSERPNPAQKRYHVLCRNMRLREGKGKAETWSVRSE